MIFLKRLRWPALAGILVLMAFVACEEDPTTIGAGIIGNAPFTTNKAEYEVFAFNKKIEAVQTNKLPVYQLGVYNDPLYGRTEARITSQLRLSTPNPSFGSFSQAKENNLDETSPSENLKDKDGNPVDEQETIKEVMLYIPYLTQNSSQRDSDSDGVDDVFDSEPNDPNNDNDGDGVSNAQETANGTDPLDITSFEVVDASLINTFAKKFDLDSIYGNRANGFRLKVEQSTYFLRDLDPNTNFEQAQEYFSTQEFSPTFVSEVLFDGDVQISDEEILFKKEDDLDTTVDEALQVETRLNPGILVPLDTLFFRQNLIDKEGELELLSQANFTEFLRGIHLSVEPGALNEEMLLLLDLSRANITVTYEYNKVNLMDTATDTSDDITERVEGNFTLNLLQELSGAIGGNAVNTFINDAFPPQILDQIDVPVNVQKIYLKGGAGSYAELRLFNEEENEIAAAISEIKANNWIINEANLVFYVDRSTLDNAGFTLLGNDEPSREPERLYLYNTETGLPLINYGTEMSVDQTLYGTFLNYDGIVSRDAQGKADKYTIKITDHINNLIVRDSANVTLGLTITPDMSRIGVLDAMVNGGAKELPIISTLTPTGTVLFGSDENVIPANRRLKLEIFYTEAN